MKKPIRTNAPRYRIEWRLRRKHWHPHTLTSDFHWTVIAAKGSKRLPSTRHLTQHQAKVRLKFWKSVKNARLFNYRIVREGTTAQVTAPLKHAKK